jgi:hypothetical protein
VVGHYLGTQWKPHAFRHFLTNLIIYDSIEYTAIWSGIELTTLAVIAIGCKNRFKSNFLTITATLSRYGVKLRASVVTDTDCIYRNTLIYHMISATCITEPGTEYMYVLFSNSFSQINIPFPRINNPFTLFI